MLKLRNYFQLVSVRVVSILRVYRKDICRLVKCEDTAINYFNIIVDYIQLNRWAEIGIVRSELDV